MIRIKIDKELCKGCKLCVVFCPKGIIRICDKLNDKGIYAAEFVDKEGKCIGCAQCAVMCPEAAITGYKDEETKKAESK